MITRIVRIGNSQGIRIPKPFLEQSGLRDEVEISVIDNSLVIKPASNPRAGWAEAFQKLAERGEDTLLDADATGSSSWDQDEWEW